MGFRANAKIIREKTSPGSRGRWEPEARLGSLKWQGAGKGGTKWPNIRLRDRRALIVDDEALIAMALATATRIGVAVVNEAEDLRWTWRTRRGWPEPVQARWPGRPSRRQTSRRPGWLRRQRQEGKVREESQSSVLPELDQHSEAASHEAVRSKTQRRLAQSQTALLRYQGLAAIMWFRATLGATSSKFQIRAMARASTR